VPRTSTFALTNVTLPYARRLAGLGVEKAIERNPALEAGVNVYGGHVTCRPVAEALGLPYVPIASLL
ncbi:MAG: alanine dehydrogenase, partial [Acidobacteria bacterium]